LRIRAVIGISFFVAGCASHDESLGCAELVVSCPGGEAEQKWWLAKEPTSRQDLQIQSGESGCGSWLAFIKDGASARYDNVDLGSFDGEMRLRVVVSADDRFTDGGTLTLFADDMTTPVTSCPIGKTGGWFNWLVVDCGELPLGGLHSLKFQFNGTDPADPYVFNLAAFGVVRSRSPDCTVTGPDVGDPNQVKTND
jgi:hypothetical protein